MYNEGLQANNSVSITGEIVGECVFSHSVYGEGFYTFQIASKRLSDQKDILPVTISERLISKESIILGNFVRIIGQLRSYNNYQANKMSRLVLTIFAREIEMMDGDSEFAENKIWLNGFICKEPIYRKTPFGREISDVLVAVNRAYHKSDYIPCIAWGRSARYIQNLEVGTKLAIEGRIQSRFYQKKINEVPEERVAYEVSVSKIEVMNKEMDKFEMEAATMEMGVD